MELIEERSRLKALVDQAHERIKRDHAELQRELGGGFLFDHVDRFLAKEEAPLLEKAMFVLLNQFVGDHHEYFVVPRERVRVKDVCTLNPPGFCDYEIDFAAYGGSASRVVKIAIECDGLRSHAERHNARDRRKDINLQTAGWTVVRFGSREIHEELELFLREANHVNRFVDLIDRIVESRTDALTQSRYLNFVEQLTGYTLGNVVCPNCLNHQYQRLELTDKCNKCSTRIPAQRQPV